MSRRKRRIRAAPAALLLALSVCMTACGGTAGKPFETEEEAARHYEALSRNFATELVEGDLDGAYGLTARELQREMDRQAFEAEIEKAFGTRGTPTGIRGVRIDTADPGVLVEEILGFPASVRPENRRAATVVTLTTERATAELELYFSGKLRDESVAAFKLR